MNDAELSQASNERLNCTYGVPWVPEDREEPMSLEEEVGFPVTEEEYLQAEYDDQEVWPFYDDDPDIWR